MSNYDSTSTKIVGQIARPVDRLQQLLPELFSPQPQTGELLLKFELTDQVKAAISLDRVIETLQIAADRVTPIPNMPEATMGLMTVKGKVFWLVDLANLLAFPPVKQRSRQHEVIVIQAPPLSSTGNLNEELLLGLSVNHIRGTFRIGAEALEPPSVDSASGLLAPYLRGQVQHQQDTWMVLSVEALVTAKGLSQR